MAFKRALWQSGLTYQATCEACKTVVRYTDRSLDFRPWYADGFVYCPICKNPIRHGEHLAIDADGNFINPIPEKPHFATETDGVFCSKCGKKLSADDNFCSGCGVKLA